MTALMAVFTAGITPAQANFDRGKDAYDKQNWKLAIINLRPLAEDNDPRALMLLGNMYARGYGVSRNQITAYNNYHRAAVLGNDEGMVVVAAMLQQGVGTVQNYPHAIAWYNRAAKLGNPTAAFFTALFYQRGNNSPGGFEMKPDRKQAYEWFRIAASLSKNETLQQSANKLADNLLKDLSVEDVAEAEKYIKAFAPVTAESLGAPPITSDFAAASILPRAKAAAADDASAGVKPETEAKEAPEKQDPEKETPKETPAVQAPAASGESVTKKP